MRFIALGILIAQALSTVDARRMLLQEIESSNTSAITTFNVSAVTTMLFDDAAKCKCSYTGLSNGIDVSNEGRGCFYSPMLANESYHCYVSDADGCRDGSISPSSRYPGAFLRACNPLLEVLTPYNDVLPFDSVTEAFLSRKDLALYSLIVSTNDDFNDSISKWNQAADNIGTLLVPTNDAIERFSRLRLMESNLTNTIESVKMGDALKTLIVDGSFGAIKSDSTFASTMQTRSPVENLNALTLSYVDAQFLEPYIDVRSWFTRTFDKLFRHARHEQIMSRVHSVPRILPLNLVIERSTLNDNGTITKPLNNVKFAVQDVLFARNGAVFVVDGLIEPALNNA